MKCDKCGYSDNGSGDWAHVCGTVNIMSGADIHAGDGGYSLGTKEDYDAFVKNRNHSMNRRKQIEENIRLCDEETKKRLSNPFYRIIFELYHLKKRVKNWFGVKE